MKVYHLSQLLSLDLVEHLPRLGKIRSKFLSISIEIMLLPLINSYSLGFIGNILALIIFSSLNEFCKMSTGLLFLLLTISNFIHLSTLTIESLGIYGYQLIPSLYFECHLIPFVQNVTRGLSTYLSVGIAIDRLIRSELPMRSRILCTRRNVVIFSTILLTIFSSLWLVYLVPFSSRYAQTGRCVYESSNRFAHFLININIPARAVVLCIIPVVLMGIANLRMLRNIRQSQLRVADAMKTANDTTSVVITGPVCRRVSAMDRMLLYMMICNILTFILTQIPFHLYSVAEVYRNVFSDETDTLIYGMILIWSSVYFGIAFYLYCLTSPLFRRKFLNLSKKISSTLLICRAKL